MLPNRHILDSGAVTFLAGGSSRAQSAHKRILRVGSPLVLSPTLLECLPPAPRDANVNRYLKQCQIVTEIPERLVRLAVMARHEAGKGSALDALVTAYALGGGAVVTGDLDDFTALAAHLPDVTVLPI